MHRFLNFASDSHKARPDILLRTIGIKAFELTDERVDPMRSVDTNITSEDLNIPLEISSRLQLRALLVKFLIFPLAEIFGLGICVLINGLGLAVRNFFTRFVSFPVFVPSQSTLLNGNVRHCGMQCGAVSMFCSP